MLTYVLCYVIIMSEGERKENKKERTKMRVFIDGFYVIKDGKTVDDFSYTRRGNTYEVCNNSGCLCSGSFKEADALWNDTVLKFKTLSTQFGFEIVTK